MKDWYLKLNSEQKVIFINFILLFAGLILILPFSIIFTLYGLLIGWAIGSLANIIASILIFKSTSLLLTDKPAVGLYIVYYICRVLIYVAVFVLLALFLGMDKARAEMLIPTMMLMVTVLLAFRRRMEKGVAR